MDRNCKRLFPYAPPGALAALVRPGGANAGPDFCTLLVSLNFSQFVEGRQWSPQAREGLEGVRVFAGDGLGNGEKMVSFSASVYGLQSVIN